MVFRRQLLDLAAGALRPAAYGWPDGQSMAHDEWIYLLASATGSVVFYRLTRAVQTARR